MIFTFYSFKGGVGRSMALANVAEILYRNGLNVLMIDFDLEAPGLERFFTGPNFPTTHVDILRSRGVLDLLLSYKTLRAVPLQNPIPVGAPPLPTQVAPGSPTAATLSSVSPAAGSLTSVAPVIMEPLENFIIPIYPAQTAGTGMLSLMPAGRRDEDKYPLYANRVRSFDWEDFYLKWNGEQFFDWLSETLNGTYHVILIDSRTGITEMSGVCTHHLADAVVLFVAANQQNIDGTKRIATSLSSKELIAKARNGRRLPLLLVPSRIESGEGDKLDEFAGTFQAEMAPFIDRGIAFQTNAFVDLKIPYIQYYAYMENVAVREPDKPKSADLIAAYNKVTSAMFELVPRESPIYLRYQTSQTKLTSTETRLTFAPAPPDFVGREWVFDLIGKWLDETDRPMMIITGDPGVGKTALAARLVEMASGRVAGRQELRLSATNLIFAYSCTSESVTLSFIADLARALASRLPQFAVALSNAVSSLPDVSVRVQQRIGATQGGSQAVSLSLDSISIGNLPADVAFRYMILKPLLEVGSSDGLSEPILVLVDGLEATAERGDDNLATLLSTASQPGAILAKIKFLILTRHDPRVLQGLFGRTIDLNKDAPKSLDDIRKYAEARLERSLPTSQSRAVATQVSALAAGIFLHAKLTLDALLEGSPTPPVILARIDEVLTPSAIPVSLRQVFKSTLQQSVGSNFDRWAERYRPLLGTLAAAQNELTLEQLTGIMGWRRSEMTDALRLLGQFLHSPEPSGPFRIFHAALATFLLTDIEYGVSAAEAHERIAEHFISEHEGQWANCQDHYALRYTAYHLSEALRETPERRKRRELLDSLMKLLQDLDYLEARLAKWPVQEVAQDIGQALAHAAVMNHPGHAELAGLDYTLLEHGVVLEGWDRQESPTLFLDLLLQSELLVGSQLEEAATRRRATLSKAATDATVTRPRMDNSMRKSSSPTQGEQDSPLRDLPISVRIELIVWEQAKTVGRGLLMFSLGLCSITLIQALFRAMGMGTFSLHRWIALVVFTLGAVGAVFCLQALLRESFKRPSPAFFDTSPSKSPSHEPWQTLPEIISLRAGGKRYPLIGDLSAASPFLEITTIVLLVTAAIAAVSSYVSFW
jgi:hypothetical protein